jgi:hypothetical protein
MSGTPTANFEVSDLDQWGRLVKSWATGLDYVDTDWANQPPRTFWVNTTWSTEAGRTPGPKTVYAKDASGNPLPWCLPAMTAIDVPRSDGTKVKVNAVAMSSNDFQNMVGQAQIVVTMPAQYKNVVVLQGDDETMVLRIPSKNKMQGSEDDLLNGVPYPIPPYYNQLYGGPPTLPTYQNQGQLMWLHADRMGEYTMNNCD